MPVYDLICTAGHERIDAILNIGERPPCLECGKPTMTLWRGKAACVIGDDFPGGVLIRNGICWPDGSPRKYYSKTEMKAEAKKRGLQNHVEHIGLKGSDKNPHTTRWT